MYYITKAWKAREADFEIMGLRPHNRLYALCQATLIYNQCKLFFKSTLALERQQVATRSDSKSSEIRLSNSRE